MGQHEEDQLIIQRLKDEMRQMDALMVSVSKNDDAEILRLRSLLDSAYEVAMTTPFDRITEVDDGYVGQIRTTYHGCAEIAKQLLTKLGGNNGNDKAA